MKKKSLTELISDLKGNENVVNWHEIEPREAKTRPMPESIDERIKAALSKRGIDELYTHQYSAFQYVQKGESIVTVTPTASGKRYATTSQSCSPSPKMKQTARYIYFRLKRWHKTKRAS